MKIQKGSMLIENMGLKKGEIFKTFYTSTGKSFKMCYVGTVERNGKIYDKLVPVKD